MEEDEKFVKYDKFMAWLIGQQEASNPLLSPDNIVSSQELRNAYDPEGTTGLTDDDVDYVLEEYTGACRVSIQ
jgi:hypothetical protein